MYSIKNIDDKKVLKVTVNILVYYYQNRMGQKGTKSNRLLLSKSHGLILSQHDT